MSYLCVEQRIWLFVSEICFRFFPCCHLLRGPDPDVSVGSNAVLLQLKRAQHFLCMNNMDGARVEVKNAQVGMLSFSRVSSLVCLFVCLFVFL